MSYVGGNGTIPVQLEDIDKCRASEVNEFAIPRLLLN